MLWSQNSANDLLRSYLSNRKQYVQIDDISSTIVSINTGVHKVRFWDLSCLITMTLFRSHGRLPY